MSTEPNLIPSLFPALIGSTVGLHVLLIDPVEIARQMTLIDQALFVKLEPWEFLGGAWMKPDSSVRPKHWSEFMTQR